MHGEMMIFSHASLSEKRQLEYYNMISTTLYVSLLFTFFGGFQVSKTLQIKVVYISFLDDLKVEEYFSWVTN